MTMFGQAHCLECRCNPIKRCMHVFSGGWAPWDDTLFHAEAQLRPLSKNRLHLKSILKPSNIDIWYVCVRPKCLIYKNYIYIYIYIEFAYIYIYTNIIHKIDSMNWWDHTQIWLSLHVWSKKRPYMFLICIYIYIY